MAAERDFALLGHPIKLVTISDGNPEERGSNCQGNVSFDQAWNGIMIFYELRYPVLNCVTVAPEPRDLITSRR